MNTTKEKIIIGCIVVGIMMTIFSPQKIQMRSRRDSQLINERVEYGFIVGQNNNGLYHYEQTSIAYDRLILQYLILVGAGFVVYLLSAKKEDSRK